MNPEKNQISILVVDDERGMREMLALELNSQGYHVVQASDGNEALAQIQQQRFALMITDLKMPHMSGLELLDQAKKMDPKLEVIMTTGHATVSDAVSAMKNGAYDFLLKPFQLEELNALIEKVLEKKELKTLVALYEASKTIFSTMDLDKLLETIMDTLQKVLGVDEGSIMLLGEDKKLRIVASRGLPDEVARQVQLEIGERVAGLVAKERRGRILINGIEKYEEFKGLETKPRIRSSVLCPLIVQDELLGVLNLNRVSTLENFTVSDFQSASIFANQAALAIQNAKLYSTLQEAYENLEHAQSELVQSEKLASIGRLVAGVAHELNNPLTSVIGYAQLAQGINNLDEIRSQLPIIYSEALRCSKIVKDLLLFARRQKIDSQSVDACLLVEETLRGLSLELEKRSIKIKKYFASSSILFQADPHLLKQVFVNILTNAYQALEEVSQDRQIEIKIQVVEQKVQFVFKDNGPGIPKEVIHRIFDPFYTTKEVGKGTGLGLSLSYGIIKEHHGFMDAVSTLKKETIFTIELPLKVQEESPSVVVECPEELNLELLAGARILLAEDELAIRNLMIKIFEEQGCQLEVVSDGEKAFEKLKNQDFDLILCDYRMPKLDGIQLFSKIEKLKPEMMKRFLFITGSTEFFQESQLVFLLKPFTRNELLSKVIKVMGEVKRETRKL